MNPNKKIWLITGASTGIGRVLATEALKRGHLVAATARNTDSLTDITATYGDKFLPVKLDVNVESDIKAAVNQVIQHWGAIDVLINNAGYGLEGAIEELTMDQIRHQMETNFFGLVGMIQQTTPHMRQNGGGWIVNVASIAGIRGYMGIGAYNASKFAVVGLSEALYGELAPFNIRVSIVEPGPYKSDWAGRSLLTSAAIANQDANSPYRDLNSLIVNRIQGHHGKQPGEPVQIASVLIDGAEKNTAPLHMIFGDPAITIFHSKLEQFNDQAFMQLYPHSRFTI